jgi:hypothetical protein
MRTRRWNLRASVKCLSEANTSRKLKSPDLVAYDLVRAGRLRERQTK